MPANTQPIFSRLGDVQWNTAITAANTAMDGTGTVVTVFTADATNGGYVNYIKFKAAGTNVATVARIFVNNGSTNATAANNALIGEVTLAATTGSNSSGLTEYTYPLNFALPPGYKINVALGTAVVSGWIPSVVGGKY